MTKDDLEMNNDNEISTKKEEYDPSSYLGIFLMNNLLGPYTKFFSGTLLFIMYLYQNYNYEGSSFFSIRFWALLFIGEIILGFSLGLLTGIFSYAIAFICETLIPLFFKKIETVKNIKVSSFLVLTVSSLVILLFITWKFSYYSFNYTYGNFTLTQIIKATISNQEILNQPDGSIFVGEIIDEKPHGQGEKNYPNGDMYSGEFKGGERHGYGTYTWSNGSKYVGEWKDGKEHGQGTWDHPEGDRYVGEYKYSKFHGLGKLTAADGVTLEVEWKEGVPNGQGIMTTIDGSKIVGEFYSLWKAGNGISYDKNGKLNGRYINGEWIRIEHSIDDLSGNVKYYFNDGSKYNFTGRSKNETRKETGILFQYGTSSEIIWKTVGVEDNNPKYKGEITNGKPHGFGVLHPNGYEIVVGEWKNGKEWNTGYSKKDGSYIGKYENGKVIERFGVLYWGKRNNAFDWYPEKWKGKESSYNKDFGKYEGNFKNGQENGQGTYINHDGDKYVGEYKDGRFLNGIVFNKEGNIIAKYENGERIKQ